MISNLQITRSSGAVVGVGNTVPSLKLRLGDTQELAFAFTDDAGNVIALPAGSTGRVLLKQDSAFLAKPVWEILSWTVTGEGNARRYRFTGTLDSEPLRQAMGGDTFGTFKLQLAYVANGLPQICDGITVTIENSYFQTTDTAPPLPLGGPEAWQIGGEVWAANERVISGERWAFNMLRSGTVESIRLSVDEYHVGLEVQIKVNGVDLFTAPVTITAQTQSWERGDELIALLSLTAAARIDVVTTFSGTDYGTACKGLRLDIAQRTSSTIETEGLVWLGESLVAGANINITPDEDGKLVITGEAGGGGVWGGITGTLTDQTDLGSALNAKADLVDGMVPTSQIPAIAITEFLGSIASQSAMLALSGQRGDWCNRSDVHKAFVATAEPLSSLGNWAAIDYPAAPVLSVNGQSGTIVLGASDVSAYSASAGAALEAAAVASGAVLQTKRVVSSAQTTLATDVLIKGVTTAVAMTMGTEILSATITPKSASSRVAIRVLLWIGVSSPCYPGALVGRSDDSTARAQSCVVGAPASRTDFAYPVILELDEVTGTTSAITYKVRAAGNGGGGAITNRCGADTSPPNLISAITITEYVP